MKLPKLESHNGLPEDEARKIVRRAKRKARKIVADAQAEALQQVADAATLKASIEKEFREHLAKVAAQVAAAITEKALMEVNRFNEELKERIRVSEKAERTLVAEEFDEAKKEIEAYKRQRLAEIDAKVARVIEEVTRKFVGESLSVEQHKNLVIKALEDAKRRNLL